MKSKKIVALALTAAIAISTASATAFAAKADVKTKAALNEQKATITLEDSDKDKYGYEVFELPVLDDTTLYKFLGWSETEHDITEFDTTAEDAFEAELLPNKVSLFSIYDGALAAPKITPDEPALADESSKITEDDIKESKKNPVTIYPVYRRWASEEEAAEAAKAKADKASDAEKEAAREEELKKGDAEHFATDNVKNADNKPETKKAEVIADKDGGKDDPFTDKEAEHIRKIVGIEDNKDNVIYYLYQVNVPKNLLDGKTARITLPVASTAGLNVKVYEVVDAYSKKQIKGLNIGEKDVTFWGTETNPYVVVLTPKDADPATSTSNPGTGDFSAVPVALLAAAALGATGFVAYKKRKAE